MLSLQLNWELLHSSSYKILSISICLCAGFGNKFLVLIITVHLTWSNFFYMQTSKTVYLIYSLHNFLCIFLCFFLKLCLSCFSLFGTVWYMYHILFEFFICNTDHFLVCLPLCSLPCLFASLLSFKVFNKSLQNSKEVTVTLVSHKPAWSLLKNSFNNSRLLFDIQVHASPSKQMMSVRVRNESSLLSTALSCFSIYCATCIRAKTLFVRYVLNLCHLYISLFHKTNFHAHREISLLNLRAFVSTLLLLYYFPRSFFLKMPCKL